MGPGRREDSSNVSVIRFGDAILDADNIQPIRTQLFQRIDDGARNILLDFHDVRFVSSAALGFLISLQKKVAAVDGTLIMCDLKQEILEVMVATNLDQLFRVCRENADVALTYFGAT